MFGSGPGTVRVAAGPSRRDPWAAEIGLANTVFGVCVEAEGRVVGIGRILGGGGLFFQVVDVAVLPEHQKKGLGAKIPVGRIRTADRRGGDDRFLREIRLQSSDTGVFQHVVHDHVGHSVLVDYELVESFPVPASRGVTVGVSQRKQRVWHQFRI